jgi:hypothetical protein
MVAVRNDSDAPLRVRFWIGDRRQQAAGQPLEMTADRVLEIAPYGTTQYKLSAFSSYQSPTESFIRVQVEPVGPSFQTMTQYWYELNPPSPFAIRIYGTKPQLRFERMGPGSMAQVPPAYWFHATPAGGGPTTAAAWPTPASSSNTKPISVVRPTPGGSPALVTTNTAVIKPGQATKATRLTTATPPTTATPVVSVPDSGMDGR